jgi:hypothetical protein
MGLFLRRLASSSPEVNNTIMLLDGYFHIPALGAFLFVAIAFALLLVGAAWVNRRWRNSNPNPPATPADHIPSGGAEGSNKKDSP